MSEEKYTYKEFLEKFYPDMECDHCFCQIGNMFHLTEKCCKCGFTEETPEEFGERLADEAIKMIQDRVKL